MGYRTHFFLCTFAIFFLLPSVSFADNFIKSTVEINASTPNGPTIIAGDRYGIAAANIGDLNDDGVDDLLVGADLNDTGGNARGAAFIHFMNTDGSIDSTVKIAHGTPNGPVITVNESSYGIGVAGIGDLNNDAVEDIAVGAISDGGQTNGALFIHYMNTDGSIDSTVKISGNTANGPVLNSGDFYGVSVANIGDLNDDGVVDIAVGAFTRDSGKGAAFIHFMNTDGSIDSTVLIDDATTNGAPLNNNVYYGRSVAGLGDLNGDTVEDIAIGAYSTPSSGAVYIHFMNTDGSIDSTVLVDEATGYSGARYGAAIGNIGDINEDGVVDIVIGADQDNNGGSDQGASYISFLQSSGSVRESVKISSATDNGPVIAASNRYGFGITGLGDLDENGTRDFAVGAFGDDTLHLHFMEKTAIIVSESRLIVYENNGVTETFSVTLGSQPVSDVTLTLEEDTPGEVSIDVSSLTFTSSNWNTPQDVVISGVADNIVDGSQTSHVVVSIDTGISSAEYASATNASVTIITTDSNFLGFTIIDADENIDNTIVVGEKSTSAPFTIVMGSLPTDTVTVLFTSDGAQITGSPLEIIFTPSNWYTPQTITVSAIDDTDIEGLTGDTFTYISSSNDSDYEGLTSSGDVTVIIIDDDGISFTESTGTSVSEGGATDTFDIVLTIAPASNLTVELTTDDDQITLSPSSIVFTDSNWDQPQTITVTAVDDSSYEGSHVDYINYEIGNDGGSFGDIVYGNQMIFQNLVEVAITDNDSLVDDPDPEVQDSNISTGTSAQGRYSNLVSMGKVVEAEKIKTEFPEQFHTTNEKTVISLQVFNLLIGRVTRFGNIGEHVKQLQTILNTKGAMPALGVDGHFGQKTLQAVKAFQCKK